MNEETPEHPLPAKQAPLTLEERRAISQARRAERLATEGKPPTPLTLEERRAISQARRAERLATEGKPPTPLTLEERRAISRARRAERLASEVKPPPPLTPEERRTISRTRRAERLAAEGKSLAPLTREERRALSRARREERLVAERLVAERAAAAAAHRLDPQHPHWARHTLPDKRPLVDGNMLSSADLAAHRAALEKLGIRPIPYPAASIVAFVSDVDGSLRSRYAGYKGQIVDKHGLDFGDSTWLTPQYIHEPLRPPSSMGFGFFSRRFDDGEREPAHLYAHTRTLAENLIEYHLGNVDHFHSFLPNGPRTVVSGPGSRNGVSVEFAFDRFIARGITGARNFFLAAICAIGRVGTISSIESIEVEAAPGAPRGDFKLATAATHGERPRYLFEARSHPGAEHDMPHLPHVRRIRLICADEPSAMAIDRLVLMSASTAILRSLLSRLHGEFNVESPLVTDHSGFHFRNELAAARKDELLRDQVALDQGKGISAVHGAVRDESGEEMFTTEADDPRSLFQIMPFFVSGLAGAYVVPAGGVAASREGWDTLSLISPALMRSGDGVYIAQRSMPPPANDPASKVKSHADTMMQRLVRTLERAREKPGAAWPIYTHLGGIAGDLVDGVPPRAQPPPDPYFEPEPLERLQDAVFNVTGAVPPNARICFVRATQAYDYSLMLRGLPANTRRIAADVVEITSWTDEILEQHMPRSPAMLWGVTFYCDDPARAEVRLDGRPLALTRNPADETGRASVTVAESDLRFSVFGALNPVRRAIEDVAVAGGSWTWRGDHGRLEPEGAAPARLRIALHGWRPAGSQALSFRLRRRTSGSAGVLVEPLAGGAFFVGDASLCPDGVEARYTLERHAPAPGEWRTIAAPFTDLSWRPGAAPGGPMPSHPLAAVTLIASGAGVEFADVAFLRPRSTALSRRADPRYCLAGTVPGFAPGQTVQLAPANGGGAGETRVVDQRGAFCFTGLASGIYRLWTGEGDERRVDRRGERVEIAGDEATIELSSGPGAA